MPGDFIIETLLRGFLEIVLYGILYYTGAFALSRITFGQLRLAPLNTLGEKDKKKRVDWNPWIHRPGRGKALKAEWVCLTGVFVWVLAGCFLYFASHAPKSESGYETAIPAERN